jgi:YHS domain-containing protein
MKKSLILVAGALAALPLAVAVARPDDKPALPAEVNCAVQTGAKVNVEAATKAGKYTDYEYTRYFFCCGGCPGAFAKDQEKFTKNVGVSLQKIDLPEELSCAVMGDHKVKLAEATDKKLFSDYNGRRYYFCCAGCEPQFKGDPEKFAKNGSISIGQIPLPKEVSCAVMGGNKVNVAAAIEKKSYADFNGRRYFFCCAGCPEAFKKEPAKFAANASLPSPKREIKQAKAAQ